MAKTITCVISIAVLTAVGAGEEPRVDRFGDPLPPGAIASLRTTRLRRPQAVFKLCFSPDGKILASAGDGPVRLWDARSGKELRHFGGLARVRSLAFSPDGKTLAIGGLPPRPYFFGDSGTPNLLSLYDTSTGKQIWKAEGHEGAIDSLAFSPNGKTLVTAGGPITGFGTGPELMVWDAATGERQSVLSGHGGFVKDVALLPCGERLVSVGDKALGDPLGSEVRLWDRATGTSSVTLEIPSRRQVWIVKPTDGRTLAVVDEQTLYRWDMGANPDPAGIRATRKVVPLEVPDEGITSAPAITDDGKTLIVGCRDGVVRFLDIDDGRERRRIQAHARGYMRVAISPDRRVLATHGPRWQGETSRLWNATLVWDLRRAARKAVSAAKADRPYIKKYKPDKEIQRRLADCKLALPKKEDAGYLVVPGLEKLFENYPRSKVIREILWFRGRKDRSTSGALSLYMLCHVYRMELSWEELASIVAPYLLIDDSAVRVEFAQLFLVASRNTLEDEMGPSRLEWFLKGFKHSPHHGMSDSLFVENGDKIVRQRFRTAPLSVIGFAYETSPETSLRMMLDFYGSEEKVDFSAIRLGEHAVSGTILKKRFSVLRKGQVEPEAQAAITEFATHPSWWVRLYTAEIMRQQPDFRDDALIGRLRDDPHPLVLRAIHRIDGERVESEY